MSIINFFTEQLEQLIIYNTPQGTEYIIRFVSCLPKVDFKKGSCVFNTLLNKLSNVMPELHIPGYNYRWSFTKLDKRLARGDKPVNKLDKGCQQHDIFYRDHKYTKERHVADKELVNIADERMNASDASVREKTDAALVGAGMECNRFFGMGFGKY